MGHRFLVADGYKHGHTYSLFPSIHGHFIFCGCRAVILDRQAIHVRSLLRPFRVFGIRSTLSSYGYLAFRIKFASTAGGLPAGAQSNKPRMEPTCVLFSKLQYPMQEELCLGSIGPLGLQPDPELPMLWARRGLISWAQYYPQCLEKVQLERSVWSSKFSSFLEPDGV